MTCNVQKLTDLLTQYRFMNDINMHLLKGSLTKAKKDNVSIETVENSLYWCLLSFKLDDLKRKFYMVWTICVYRVRKGDSADSGQNSSNPQVARLVVEIGYSERVSSQKDSQKEEKPLSQKVLITN